MIINLIRNYINKGHLRSVKAKKNILFSFILKGISIAIGLIYVPLILDYLDPERYGIWLTLSSIVTWFMFFDAGLGNGLRNKLAEALALGEKKLAKEYISTTYAILIAVFLTILILFYFINPFINWQTILNTNIIVKHELSILTFIVFTFFFLRFIFNLIGIILLADQRPAMNNAMGPLGNIFSLIIILILIQTTKGSLIALAATLSGVPLFVLIITTLYFFKKDYKALRPSYHCINFSHSKVLMGLGIKFFILQIGAIVLFSISNFIITQVFSPNEVTIYNIAYKYFYTAIMLHSIIMSPFWSAFTEAFVNNDLNWIKKIIRNLNILSVGFIVLSITMVLISAWVYKIWIGDRVQIPFSLTLGLGIFIILTVIVSPFTQFISGVGKLHIGLRIIVFKIIAYIPLALFLCKTSLGISGVIYATCILQTISLFIEPYQTYLIINNKATGIWNK